eukprot:GFKZ01012441.1.p3 GENE.GFKZ01012441.1~~GFKZ01012441.1.p3  ORF type:complete len:100 (-),score=7.83 GFKZ01012441.1:129-428(-)
MAELQLAKRIGMSNLLVGGREPHNFCRGDVLSGHPTKNTFIGKSPVRDFVKLRGKIAGRVLVRLVAASRCKFVLKVYSADTYVFFSFKRLSMIKLAGKA